MEITEKGKESDGTKDLVQPGGWKQYVWTD